jgi:hypothetical protein
MSVEDDTNGHSSRGGSWIHWPTGCLKVHLALDLLTSPFT